MAQEAQRLIDLAERHQSLHRATISAVALHCDRMLHCAIRICNRVQIPRTMNAQPTYVFKAFSNPACPSAKPRTVPGIPPSTSVKPLLYAIRSSSFLMLVFPTSDRYCSRLLPADVSQMISAHRRRDLLDEVNVDSILYRILVRSRLPSPAVFR